MASKEPSGSEVEDSGVRWRLVRDLCIFQVKLALDGLKDIVLAPVTMVVGIAGILLRPDNPGDWFRRVLRRGQKFDDFVALYSQVEERRLGQRGSGIDRHFGDLERAIGQAPIVSKVAGKPNESSSNGE